MGVYDKDKKLSKEERMARLEANLSESKKEEIAEKRANNYTEIVTALQEKLKEDTFDTDIVLDTDEDTEFARAAIKKMVEDSEETLSDLRAFAGDLETPQGYDSLAKMMKTVSDLTKDLIEIQKGRKEVRKSRTKEGPGQQQSNGSPVNVFVGSTTELQKRLKEAEKSIDV